jgi:serine/threonine protein kinase
MTRGLSDLEQYRNRDRNAVMEKARQVVEDEIARSNAFEEAAVESLSRFAPEEIGMGRVVGRGGFCVVRECTSIRLIASQQPSSPGGKGADSPDHSARDAADVVNTSHQRFQHSSSLAEDSKRSALAFTRAATPTRSRLTEALFSNLSSSNHETERRRQRGFVSRNVESFASAPASVESESSREQLARRVWSKKSHRRYVVKKVEPELYHQDRVTYLRGVIDLALETYYLASLSSHPHILAIRGVSASGSFEAGYFIVLDRLEDVLSKRLTAWMHQDRATRGLTGAFTGGRRKVKDLLTERILVSIDIVSAMEYLHSRNIIYRDLKPDNVGFDAEGSVKVFDFGLARQLHDDERGEDGLYHMTGFTGTGMSKENLFAVVNPPSSYC